LDRCLKSGNERCRVFCRNEYRQQRAFADADHESQTLGKKQVGVPVAEASGGMKAVSATDGVKMFEKLAGTVES
jgi:hypothetical protein